MAMKKNGSKELWNAHQSQKNKQETNYITSILQDPFSSIKGHATHAAPYLVIFLPICVHLKLSTFAPPLFLWPQTDAATTINQLHRTIILQL